MRLNSPEYTAFLKEVETRHSSTLRILAGHGLHLELDSFSIYVDGNIRRTPQRLRHLGTPELEVIPLVPGTHRVVVREADVRKTNRRESNTVFLELNQGEEETLLIRSEGGALTLTPQGA